MDPVDWTFVIPAYNEEDSIETALRSIDDAMQEKLRYEIVVVNDGSRDKTLPKVITYASRNRHVKVIDCPKNMGKGHAVTAGFAQAAGEVVIFADGDTDIDLSTVSRYVACLQHGDIVIASKWHPQSVVEMPLVRRILSHGFNLLVRVFTGVKLRDTQSGLKAIRRTAFKDVFPRLAVKRYAFDVELLAVANLYGLKVVEMPVRLRMSAAFEPKDILRMFVDLLGIAYRLRVIRWYQRSISTQNGHQDASSTEARGYYVE